MTFYPRVRVSSSLEEPPSGVSKDGQGLATFETAMKSASPP